MRAFPLCLWHSILKLWSLLAISRRMSGKFLPFPSLASPSPTYSEYVSRDLSRRRVTQRFFSRRRTVRLTAPFSELLFHCEDKPSTRSGMELGQRKEEEGVISGIGGAERTESEARVLRGVFLAMRSMITRSRRTDRLAVLKGRRRTQLGDLGPPPPYLRF